MVWFEKLQFGVFYVLYFISCRYCRNIDTINDYYTLQCINKCPQVLKFHSVHWLHKPLLTMVNPCVVFVKNKSAVSDPHFFNILLHATWCLAQFKYIQIYKQCIRGLRHSTTASQKISFRVFRELLCTQGANKVHKINVSNSHCCFCVKLMFSYTNNNSSCTNTHTHTTCLLSGSLLERTHSY